MRHLVLVRHGESLWNAEGRIQGQRCAGLSLLGHEQASHVARALARRHPTARLVTSDLQRAAQTAAPVAEALAVQARHDVRLRERSFGAWEGRLRDEVREDDPALWARWRDGEDVVAEVGGEPAPLLAERAVEVCRELVAVTPEGGATIAVTHGGTIWHGVHALLDLPVPTLAGVANASVAELVSFREGDGRLFLDRWNEVGHLAAEVVPTEVRREASDVPPVGR